MNRALAACTCALLGTIGLRETAHAELPHDVDTVAEAFRAAAAVELLSPRFYSSGMEVPLSLPGAATAERTPGCTVVAVLGATSTSFVLRVASVSTEDGAADEDIVPSVAGIASITRCGDDRSTLDALTIEMRSPHGVIEGVVARGTAPLPSLRTLLPHRDPGVIAPPARPGTPPASASLIDRTTAVERRLHEARALDIERRLMPTDPSGAGHVLLTLEPGCHLIAALGVSADRSEKSAHDIDAELTWVSGGTAATDRTESPDATLTACTGERQVAMLSFAGSAPSVPVLVVRGRTELPSGIPERFGEEPRARMAKTLLERHIPPPGSPPSYESYGVGGITVLPLEVVPGECYLAAVAPLQEGARLVSLAVTTGLRRTVSHTDDADDAAIVTWCAGSVDRATMEVELHGSTPPLWIAAVWPSGRQTLGAETH